MESEQVKVILDGKEITIEQLKEAQSKASVKIVECKDAPGTYKTLTRLNGWYSTLKYCIMWYGGFNVFSYSNRYV